MITRVSTQSMQNNMLANITSNRDKLYQLQIQAMTGQKVSSILDNPTDAAKILGLKVDMSKLDSYKLNVQAAQGEYDTLDSTLSVVADKLQRVNELVISAANETHNPDSLKAIKNEISTIKQTIIDLSNTQYNGKYIFSGTNTGTPTAQMSADGTITYGGTPQTGDYKRQLEVAEGVYLTVNVAGDSVFGSYDATATPPSGSGIFGTLSNIENALDKAMSADTTISAEGFSAIRESIEANQADLDNVTTIRTQYGTYAQKADMSETTLDENLVVLEQDRSNLQDVDLFEAYSNLSYQQYALQASMQISAMTMQQGSLLNYI